jgi:hypothetical protein
MNPILTKLKELGYVYFEGKWDLNIVGIRSNSTKSDSFDDRILVICKNDADEWQEWSWSATTDPGLYWLRNPMNVAGTGILKEGQWRGCWKLGLHKGKKALVQIKPVTVYRDKNKDAVIDFAKGESSGIFGINVHRAGLRSTKVDKWSAGCQVFANDSNFEEFLFLCKKQVDHGHGDVFSYTLLKESEI